MVRTKYYFDLALKCYATFETAVPITSELLKKAPAADIIWLPRYVGYSLKIQKGSLIPRFAHKCSMSN